MQLYLNVVEVLVVFCIFLGNFSALCERVILSCMLNRRKECAPLEGVYV